MKEFGTNYFICLLAVLFLFSCKSDDETIPMPVEKYSPKIIKTNVRGKEVCLHWSHETSSDPAVKYVIELNGVENKTTNDSLVLILDYNNTYDGNLYAIFSDGDSLSTNFHFETDKSKTLLLQDNEDNMYSIDAYTYDLNWKKNLQANSDIPSSTITVWNNSLVVCDNNISGYSLENGERLWSFEIEGGVKQYGAFPWCISGDILYIRVDSNYECYCLAVDLKKQELVWRKNINGTMYLLGEFIYLFGGFADDDIVALTKDTGDRVWNFNFDSPHTGAFKSICGRPVLNNNRIYIYEITGYLYSINSLTGKKNWSMNFGLFKYCFASSVFVDDDIIVPVEKQLYSINTKTKKENYVCTMKEGLISSEPLVVDDKIIIASCDNRDITEFLCVDKQTGEELWRNEIPYNYFISMLNVEDEIFVQTSEYCYSISATSGELLHTFNISGRHTSSPIVVIGNFDEIHYTAAANKG